MKTAIYWLVEQLNKPGFPKVVTNDEIKQAKEMEKQQIINAVDGYPLDKRHLDGEQYYKETFKQK